MAESGAAQLVHGLGDIKDRGDHALQVGVAGAHIGEHATHIVLQQAQVVFVQVAGQANRNPGFNGDRGPLGSALGKLQGGHTDGGGVAAGQVGSGAGAAQADELAIRIAFGKEDGVENREESTEMRRKVGGQGAYDMGHVVRGDVQRGVVVIIARGNDGRLGGADFS